MPYNPSVRNELIDLCNEMITKEVSARLFIHQVLVKDIFQNLLSLHEPLLPADQLLFRKPSSRQREEGKIEDVKTSSRHAPVCSQPASDSFPPSDDSSHEDSREDSKVEDDPFKNGNLAIYNQIDKFKVHTDISLPRYVWSDPIKDGILREKRPIVILDNGA